MRHVVPHEPQLLSSVSSSTHSEEQQVPVPQLVPFATAVQALVLVPGWQLRQGFVELVAPDA
jgi:hypothetical protein